jgi:hypothetical protein
VCSAMDVGKPKSTANGYHAIVVKKGSFPLSFE